MTPLQSVERELARHAKALRLLARDLVGETHADDLVQETALRALRSPPAEPSGLFAWLATILRRLAQNHRRATERRQRRETLSAVRPDDSEPPVDETAARRDSLRAVTAALFALPEPYQTTLLLRYFEDLTPTQIAARTRVPLATVKSRLQRGVTLLRDVLDQKDPSRRWRAALLLATGGALPVAATTVAAGTLLMAHTGKMVVAAAALCGGAVLFWQFSDPVAPSPQAPTHETRTVAAANDAAGEMREREETQREAVLAIDPELAADLQHPFAYELHCRVVDRDGLPVAGAKLAFAPLGCALNTWREATDADGNVVLRWRARRASMTLALGVGSGSRVPRLMQFDAQAGHQHRIVLLGEASSGAVRYLLATNAPGNGAKEGTFSLSFAPTLGGECESAAKGGDCRTCHTKYPARHRLDVALQVADVLHPEATFADRVLPQDGPGGERVLDVVESRLVDMKQLVASGELRLSGVQFETLAHGATPATAAATKTGKAAGIVFGEDGKPVARQTIVACREGDRPVARARTKKDGSFEFDSLPPGTWRLRAGGGDGGVGIADVTVAEGAVTTQNLFLRRDATIRGLARDATGQPMAGATVEFEAAGEPWRDLATVDKAGAFVVPNLPTGGGRLLLFAQEGDLPVAVLPAVLPDSGEVSFDLGKTGMPKGSLRVRVQIPEGLAQRGEVRAWQLDTGRCAPVPPMQDGSHALLSLMPGFYRIEVGSEGSGWVDLGQHWVDGKGETDLGTVTLPEPALLAIEDLPAQIAPPRARHELYHRRDIGDVRAAPETELGRDRYRLPPGRWLVLWRDGSGALRSRELELRAGQDARFSFGR